MVFILTYMEYDLKKMSLAILDVHNNILLLFKKFQPKSQNNLQQYL